MIFPETLICSHRPKLPPHLPDRAASLRIEQSKSPSDNFPLQAEIIQIPPDGREETRNGTGFPSLKRNRRSPLFRKAA